LVVGHAKRALLCPVCVVVKKRPCARAVRGRFGKLSRFKMQESVPPYVTVGKGTANPQRRLSISRKVTVASLEADEVTCKIIEEKQRERCPSVGVCRQLQEAQVSTIHKKRNGTYIQSKDLRSPLLVLGRPAHDPNESGRLLVEGRFERDDDEPEQPTQRISPVPSLLETVKPVGGGGTKRRGRRKKERSSIHPSQSKKQK
jgi:hypothetical protein